MAIAAARRKAGSQQRLTIMEKKIPVNPKFAHVQSSIDTGASAKKAPKPLSDQELAKRRKELFRRIKCSRVYEILQNIDGAEDTESVYDIVQDEPGKNDAKSVTAKSVGHESTVTRISTVDSGSLGSANARDILLVDIRSTEEFRMTRIPYAINHPAHLIVRDNFTPAMKSFKTKVKGRALVVYHNDDKQSAHYATLLVEKGWEEVWIIEGGFSEYMHSYPEGVDETS
jgi:centrosomal protein CEP41